MKNSEFLPTENLCGQSAAEKNICKQTAKKQYQLGGICSSPPVPPPTPAPTPTAPATGTSVTTAPLELHVCMGINACKGHDRNGTNSCAGTGYCATASVHHCRTLNDCRGQGGCGLYGNPSDDDTPGANECAWQGACAVPIQAERFSTEGANKGKSVWVLARKLFEERMQKAKRSYGNSPYPCGPPQAWLTEVFGSYDSCGSSGDKSCSFGYNDPAKDAQELCQKSLHPVICGAPPEDESNHGGAAQDQEQAQTENPGTVHCSAPKDTEIVHCSTPPATEPVHCGSPENTEVVHCSTPPEKTSADE